MANHKTLAPFVRYYEGGFSNNPKDPGGATMRGVTIATFRAVYGQSKTVDDLKRITDEQWDTIFKKYYWDKCKADIIESQSVANMLVDFAWHSGVSTAVKAIQQIVGVDADGVAGRVTVGAINGFFSGSQCVFEQLKARRFQFLRTRATWPTFKNGWTKRLDAIKYGSLTYSGKTVKC